MSLPPILPALALLGAPAPEAAPVGPALAPRALLSVGVAAVALSQDAPASPQEGTAPPELADPLADPAEATPGAPVADTTVTADPGETRTAGDPLEKFNRSMFTAHQKFDRAVFRPAAMGYRHVVPKPVRDGLRNAFSNLNEPVVFLNFLLQLKFGKAAETLARFVANSTLGVGGFIDVAKRGKKNLPHRDNGFGNTLALYGVKSGPYLFLPFIGPTTLRDALGGQVDGAVLPLTIGKPYDRLEYQLPRGVVTGFDARAEADSELKALFDGAVDPYATLRSVWLQNRQGEIDHLRGARRSQAQGVPGFGDPLATPPAGAQPEGTAPELSDPLEDPAAPQP